MNQPNHSQNSDYLRKDQYKDSRNLGDRAQLHRRFSNNPVSWSTWIFKLLDLQIGDQVLECGSGPGWLWRNNLDRIPEHCQIMLTDLSSGMVQEAENSLASSSHDFSFKEVDITKLPFDDDSFDIVIANHMLYHVSDRRQALSEVQRVLRTSGYLVATTVGRGHMQEVRDLAVQLSPELVDLNQKFSVTFTLENGRSQLEPWFFPIELHLYPSILNVTEVEPVISYALSSSQAKALVTEAGIQSTTKLLERIIAEKGVFQITTNSGLFKARCNK